MNPTVLRFFERSHRRISGLQPEMQKAILKSFEQMRLALGESNIIKTIQSGQLDILLERAFQPFQDQIHATVHKGFNVSRRDMPSGGVLAGLQAITFDHLSPSVLTAIQDLETKALDTLTKDVKETLRQAVREGLASGETVGSISRDLRDIIGLAPNQLDAVNNFRNMLEAGDRDALQRALRDRRFDSTLERALGQDGTGLSGEQIDRMVGAYQDNFIAFNASVNTRSATIDAYKTGQALAWDEAASSGVIPEGYTLMKQWIGVGDDRERDEHLEMNDEIVAADEPYSNGQDVAGLGDYGCRCLDRYFLEKDDV